MLAIRRTLAVAIPRQSIGNVWKTRHLMEKSKVNTSAFGARLAHTAREFQNDGYFGAYSEKTGEWEPHPTHLEEMMHRGGYTEEPTLQNLIRHDIDEARRLFRTVLQMHYHNDMDMWNKWATMEWKDGKINLARKIFLKASKIRFSPVLWQSWATMESELENYIEARRLFKVILATDTSQSIQTVMAGLGLALVEDRCGNTDKARRMLLKYKRQFPNDLHVAEAYALFEGRHGNLKLARQLFTETTHLADCTPQVYHAWGHLEYSRGNYHEALDIVDKGLVMDSLDKALLLLRALTLVKLGDEENAREAFQKHTRFARPDPRAFNAFARFEEEHGNYDTALKIYYAILKVYPNSVSNITSLAYLHEKMDEDHGLDLARETFQLGVDSAADSAQLWHNWAVFEEKHGALDQAKKLLEQATEKAPWVADFWCSLARIESKLGDVKAVRLVLDKATLKCSNQLPLLIALAKLELKQRNYKEAREACAAALKIDKTRSSIWNLRATIELPHSPDRAKGIIESALKIIPTHDHISWSILLCTYARCHGLLHDYENASTSFREAIRLDPMNFHPHMYLAEFMEKLGQYEEAKKRYEIASHLCSVPDKRQIIAKHIEKLEEKINKAN